MALNFSTTRGWTAGTLFPKAPAAPAGSLANDTIDNGVRTGGAGAGFGPIEPPAGAPPFLQDAINRILDIQANGSLGGGGNSSLINKILSSPNGYLLAPALTASMFKPGGTGGGGGGALSLAPIQNPLIGQGYNTAALAEKQRADQQQRANDVVMQLQNKIWNLQANPQARATGGGFYGAGYNQGQQLILLNQQLKAANQALQSTSQPSGWSSNPPGY